MAHGIRDISATGLYLKTDQRWYPGTMVTMSLQRSDAAETDPDRSIMVNAQVIRADVDGVGLAFVLPSDHGSTKTANAFSCGASAKTLNHFLKCLAAGDAQAMVEYILLVPLIFLLVVNVVNFGAFFFAWISVSNAARAGADYAIMGPASVGALRQASVTQLNALISADILSLPNRASAVVNICQSFNGTVKTLSGTCTSIPADAEATSFVLTSIDVTYTYVPLIPASFQFPNMNVYATIPPTTIHRRTVMRMLQ
jgi:Flp pilus assembly protein TadG